MQDDSCSLRINGRTATLPLRPWRGSATAHGFGSIQLGLEWIEERLGSLHPKNAGSVHTGSCRGFILQLRVLEKNLSPAESLETLLPRPLTRASCGRAKGQARQGLVSALVSITETEGPEGEGAFWEALAEHQEDAVPGAGLGLASLGVRWW